MKENTSGKSLPVFCLSNCLPGLLQLMPSDPCVTGSSPSFQTHTATMSHLLCGLSQNLCPHLFTWASSTTCSSCSRFGVTSVLASGHLLKTGKSSIWPCSMQEIVYFSFYPDMEFPWKFSSWIINCSLHSISALSNLVKISQKVQKLSRKGGGEQMDERGVDRQHDLIIPAGIGIEARIEIF